MSSLAIHSACSRCGTFERVSDVIDGYRYLIGYVEQCVTSTLNDPNKKSISHIAVGRRTTDASRRAGMIKERERIMY
jgi:hypothetical protein